MPKNTPGADAASEDLEQLRALLDAPVMAQAGGEEIEVRALRTGQLVQALEIAAPFFAELQQVHATLVSNGEVDAGPLFMRHMRAACQLVAVALGRDEQWVMDLEADEAAALFGQVLAVNLDFFVRRGLPAATTAMNLLAGMLKLHAQPKAA